MSTVPIRLVVSDVDGTLVQPDKSLSPGTVAAAGRLQAAGIPLSIVSARPPFGMRFLTEPLQLKAPWAGFNGGMLIGPDGATVEWNPIPADLVRAALDLFARRGVGPWLYTQDTWFVPDVTGPYVAHEEMTIRTAPQAIGDFTPHIGQAGKLVGVSKDFDLLASVEAELQSIVGDRATAHRSQDYYLDLTHRDANKGHAVEAIAAHLDLPLADVAVLGDQFNDLPMFAVAGYSVAMGNGPAPVQAQAKDVTLPNDKEGWAHAIDTLILPRAKGA